MLIHFSQQYEEYVYQKYLAVRETGVWSKTDSLSLTDKYAVWLHHCRGDVGEYLYILVWSFMTFALVVVVCSIAIFVFSPEGVYIPVVGPHPGAKLNPKKASK